VAAYEAAIGVRIDEMRDRLAAAGATLQASSAAIVGLGLTASEEEGILFPHYSSLLALLGNMVDGNPLRYTIPNGNYPADDAPALSADLYDVAQPFVRPAVFRFIARHTKAGIEELNDDVFVFEVDGSGAAVGARPNAAHIQALSFDENTGTFEVGVIEDNSAALATAAELLVDGSVAQLAGGAGFTDFDVATGVATITTDTPHDYSAEDWVILAFDVPYAALSGVYRVLSAPDTSTITVALSFADGAYSTTGNSNPMARALPAVVDGGHRVNLIYDFGGAGRYRVGARALTSAGVKSGSYAELLVVVTGAVAPAGVASIAAQPMRGRGI
jgi:hypothetical protein